MRNVKKFDGKGCGFLKIGWGEGGEFGCVFMEVGGGISCFGEFCNFVDCYFKYD